MDEGGTHTHTHTGLMFYVSYSVKLYQAPPLSLFVIILLFSTSVL